MASDDFNRGDNADLGSNWLPMAGYSVFGVVSNEAHPDPADVAVERFSTDTPTDDQESSVTLGNVEDTLDKGSGPACRMSDAGAGSLYFAYANKDASGEIQYAKDVADVTTQLGAYTGGGTPTTGLKLAIRAVGTRISVLVNDVEVAYTTDATIASGNCGMYGLSWLTEDTLDNWIGDSYPPELPEPVTTQLVAIVHA